MIVIVTVVFVEYGNIDSVFHVHDAHFLLLAALGQVCQDRGEECVEVVAHAVGLLRDVDLQLRNAVELRC